MRKLAWLIAAILWPFNTMVRFCCYCNRIMGVRRGGRGITDGMCGKCYEKDQRGELVITPRRVGKRRA